MIAVLYALAAMVFVTAVGLAIGWAAHQAAARPVDHEFDLEDES